ncbi:hypothetical protein B0H13DRAFT_1909814 [Mycena leptocephala]|nr:hypothetical protein B0H13DRAFT_1909814 [Mycena leptocephala]
MTRPSRRIQTLRRNAQKATESRKATVKEVPDDEDALVTFAKFLSDAQEEARQAEREKENGSKRPKHYTKNSDKKKYRHRKKKQALEVKGFKSVGDFIQAGKKKSGDEGMGTQEGEPEAQGTSLEMPLPDWASNGMDTTFTEWSGKFPRHTLALTARGVDMMVQLEPCFPMMVQLEPCFPLSLSTQTPTFNHEGGELGGEWEGLLGLSDGVY